MESVLLGTNVLIGLLKAKRTLSEPLISIPNWCLPTTVVGELSYGALNSGKPDKYLALHRSFISKSKIIAIDEDIAAHYAQIRLQLKQKGRPIPENDIWIAATAIAQGLPLASLDGHFDYIDGLQLVFEAS